MHFSKWFLTICFTASFFAAKTQLYFDKEKIISPYSIQNEKAEKRKQRLIDQANSLNTLNIDSSDGELESAIWAVSQFLVRTPQSDSGVARLMQQFGRLSSGNQRALMELVYGLYPNTFVTEAKRIVQQTDHPKLFAQTASYLIPGRCRFAKLVVAITTQAFPQLQQQ